MQHKGVWPNVCYKEKETEAWHRDERQKRRPTQKPLTCYNTARQVLASAPLGVRLDGRSVFPEHPGLSDRWPCVKRQPHNEAARTCDWICTCGPAFPLPPHWPNPPRSLLPGPMAPQAPLLPKPPLSNPPTTPISPPSPPPSLLKQSRKHVLHRESIRDRH